MGHTALSAFYLIPRLGSRSARLGLVREIVPRSPSFLLSAKEAVASISQALGRSAGKHHGRGRRGINSSISNKLGAGMHARRGGGRGGVW